MRLTTGALPLAIAQQVCVTEGELERVNAFRPGDKINRPMGDEVRFFTQGIMPEAVPKDTQQDTIPMGNVILIVWRLEGGLAGLVAVAFRDGWAQGRMFLGPDEYNCGMKLVEHQSRRQ